MGESVTHVSGIKCYLCLSKHTGVYHTPNLSIVVKTVGIIEAWQGLQRFFLGSGAVGNHRIVGVMEACPISSSSVDR